LCKEDTTPRREKCDLAWERGDRNEPKRRLQKKIRRKEGPQSRPISERRHARRAKRGLLACQGTGVGFEEGGEGKLGNR